MIRLRCVKEGRKLRVRIISDGYNHQANCQFPTKIRVEGQEYEIPSQNVTMIEKNGKFYYRAMKDVRVVQPEQVIPKDLKIYGDLDLTECSICMSDTETEPNLLFVIFAPCGHYCACQDCAQKCKTCPMCRGEIKQLVRRDQLQ